MVELKRNKVEHTRKQLYKSMIRIESQFQSQFCKNWAQHQHLRMDFFIVTHMYA